MKAVYIDSFGEKPAIALREVPDLQSADNSEVLVQVAAAGLNRADLLQAAGKYPPPAPSSQNIPGLEFSGVVAEVGPDVKQWRAGDRVFGITAGEAQAECLITDASLLARIPETIPLTDAAAIPEAFITAHDALVTTAGLSSGEYVLIHAVGSGVGLAGLQLATSLGCTVIGTSRTARKLDKCKQLGLDFGVVVDDPGNFAHEVSAAAGDHGVDVILDLVGAAYFEENLRALALKGRIVFVGLTSGRRANLDMGLALSKRARMIGTVLRSRSVAEKAEATSKFVSDVVPLLEKGALRATVDRVFPASEVVAAYNYLGSNQSFGKVVLEF